MKRFASKFSSDYNMIFVSFPLVRRYYAQFYFLSYFQKTSYKQMKELDSFCRLIA